MSWADTLGKCLNANFYENIFKMPFYFFYCDDKGDEKGKMT